MSGHIFTHDGKLCHRYDPTVEASIRDCLAELAELCGWDVITEHHLPGFGRIDILLVCEHETVVVEVKRRLAVANQVRKAFQQADCYRRRVEAEVDIDEQWKRRELGLPLAHVRGYLVAEELDRELVQQYEAAYPETRALSVAAMFGFLAHPEYFGLPELAASLHRRAIQRANAHYQQMQTRHAAVEWLADWADSPLHVAILADPEVATAPS